MTPTRKRDLPVVLFVLALRFLPIALFAPISVELLSPAAAIAEEGSPKSVEVDGHLLLLNGTGTRTATIFALKVYDAALYLAEPSREAEMILRDSRTKELRMRFHRDVGREKLTEAFAEGVKKNASDPDSEADSLRAFLALVPDADEGDEFVIDFTERAVVFYARGVRLGVVESPTFSRALLSVWLGAHPPSESLKRGLLGR